MSLQSSSPQTPTSPPPQALAASGGRLAQKAHAILIVALPTLAVAGAIWAALHGMVRPWHLGLMGIMYFCTILAITVGFHRLLTHRAFLTGPKVKALLTITGCMAAQGPPLYWVSNHRRHHRYVDRAGDPHSPVNDNGQPLGRWQGFWHAHTGWTLRHDLSSSLQYCPDLLQDATVRWVGRHYFKWILLGLLLPALAGLAITGHWQGLIEGVFWGGFVRLFVTYHLTNGINSAAHMWGYQRFDTGDSSRNNWFLGLFTLGEGWHNNHHADGTAAVFSRAWYEIDIGGGFILLLEKLGLAHAVRRGHTRPVSHEADVNP
ncbi:acyl-CoA desaturase [Parachitinimonas caeni]|uniref:Fatty acid desaturase n=1 Tax=Parachitinimonas caeni TaxID=3031301 RepID=A0ABT7DRS0_9NEIS|nr:fatty acid desaturase [Parachitinimonas caeni]MDK2122760.1 fatty acid desaturase [Parachitinimonas caeni]